MELIDRADHWKTAAKARRQESKLDSTEQRMEKLQIENHMLHEELDRAGQERRDVLSALERIGSPSRSARPHRLRRFLTLATAAGAAYVAGSKAGRERYEQIAGWVKRRSDTPGDWIVDTTDSVATKVRETTENINGVAQASADKVTNATDTLAEKADEIADKAQTTGTTGSARGKTKPA